MAVKLEGKVAIVTGSSRGIGKAIALQLADDGAIVVVCARTVSPTNENPGSIFETAEAIRTAGGRALPFQLDVADDSACRAMVARTEAGDAK